MYASSTGNRIFLYDAGSVHLGEWRVRMFRGCREDDEMKMNNKKVVNPKQTLTSMCKCGQNVLLWPRCSPCCCRIRFEQTVAWAEHPLRKNMFSYQNVLLSLLFGYYLNYWIFSCFQFQKLTCFFSIEMSYLGRL